MQRLFMLIISMNIILTTFAQKEISLSGYIFNEENKPLVGASVFLAPAAKGVITNIHGNYKISNLEKGRYRIEISYIGYNPVIDTINLYHDTIYTAHLIVSQMELQEVVVEGNHVESRNKSESLNIEIVNGEYLKRNLGGSLMKSIDRLPGVTTIDIGSGQSKPVIRGLGFNRVVVVDRNIKHESQQWGADHGLEIDQYSVDNIEVVKGPASLMYGSDAIGGVINLNSNDIPEVNSIGATVDLSGKTNNDFLGTSVSLFGRKDWYYSKLRFTILDYGDFKVPASTVDIYSYKAELYNNYMRNTAGNEQNINLTFGMILPKFQSSFFISDLNSKSGFFANAHGLEPRNVDTDLHDKSNRDINYPYQNVNHLKVINRSQYIMRNASLETDLGFQRNFRQEWSQYVSHGYMPAIFPDTLSFNPDLERQFDKYVYSGNMRLTGYLSEKNQFNGGITGEYQDNRIGGRGFIIPAFKQLNLGAYVIAKHIFTENSSIQAGIRYDYGNIITQEYYDWFESPVITDGDTTYAFLKRADHLNRSFSNISWSLGYIYQLNNWLLKANAGKSFRMPIAKELAANGVNYHHFSYEVGDPDLSSEISYQIDLGIEYNSEKMAIGATPFINYFPNYIFLNPGYEHDRLYGNGNQVYYYTQSRVFRYGGEIHSHYQLLKTLQLGVIGEYVYSVQLSGKKKGFTLPFSPPASVIFNIKYQNQRLLFLDMPYFSIDYLITAAQNNIVPPEEPTKGYQVINIAFGGEIRIKSQRIDINLQIQNLLNNKYFNHTSYYRLINVPEPGRNLIINISIPFSGKIKQNQNNNKI